MRFRARIGDSRLWLGEDRGHGVASCSVQPRELIAAACDAGPRAPQRRQGVSSRCTGWGWIDLPVDIAIQRVEGTTGGRNPDAAVHEAAATPDAAAGHSRMHGMGKDRRHRQWKHIRGSIGEDGALGRDVGTAVAAAAASSVSDQSRPLPAPPVTSTATPVAPPRGALASCVPADASPSPQARLRPEDGRQSR